MGNYVTTKKEGTILNNYCQGTNRNKESFWLIMNRNSDEFEIGVGRITYIKWVRVNLKSTKNLNVYTLLN